MKNFKQLCEKLEAKIIDSYENGVTIEDAEKLASEFLYAQLAVSTELKKADMDSRTRKSGVKAIRGALYLNIIQGAEKRPTEAQITALLDTDELVQGEQTSYDEAEVNKAELERYYGIFVNSHIHYKNIAKGSFGN